MCLSGDLHRILHRQEHSLARALSGSSPAVSLHGDGACGDSYLAAGQYIRQSDCPSRSAHDACTCHATWRSRRGDSCRRFCVEVLDVNMSSSRRSLSDTPATSAFDRETSAARGRLAAEAVPDHRHRILGRDPPLLTVERWSRRSSTSTLRAPQPRRLRIDVWEVCAQHLC